MTKETKEALIELLHYSISRVSRNQELLDRWKDRPKVDQKTIEKSTQIRDEWKRRRDALLAILGEQ